MDFISHSPEQTRALGAALARTLPEGTVVALVGELGAGKTLLVQGASEALGAGCDPDGEGVTSPTFVLVRCYTGRRGRKVFHVDAYRLRDARELEDLGSNDFLGREGLAFVEWADRVEHAIPRPYLLVRLRHEDEHTRSISIEIVGESPELESAAAEALASLSG